MTQNSSEYKFWSEMCVQSVDKGIISLANGAKFVDRDNSMALLSKIYVRQCYCELVNLIMKQMCRNAVVTGTPGTGKTTLRNYMVHILITNLREKGGKLCIVLDKSPGIEHDVHVFEASCEANLAQSFKWSATKTSKKENFRENLPDDHNVWYLLDVSKGNSDGRAVFGEFGRTVMFTSPNEKAYKEFIKQDCILYHMPLWRKAEAEAARKTTTISKAVFNDRWDKYRGVARPLFASDEEFEQYEKRISNAIQTLDAQTNFDQLGSSDSTETIRHLLFYFDVHGDESNPFKDASLIFGSDFIKQLVTDQLCKQVQKNLNQVIDDLHSCTPNSLKGLVLEPLALKLLSDSTWNFRVVQLGSRRGELQLGKTLSLGPLDVRKNFSSNDDFITQIGKEMKKNPGTKVAVMLEAPDKFPVVDAVAIVGTGTKRHCLLLQVTVAVKHPVKGPVAKEVLLRLISASGGAGKCALIFVLPNNRNFSSFSEQTVPLEAQNLRQYKIALTKT